MTDDSILKQIKKMIGMAEEYTPFDTDIIIAINTVLATLSQLGVDTSDKLQITGYDETWYDLFGDNEKLNFIQSYIYIKVKLLFDPPSSATTTQSFESQARELEFRINVEADKT